MNISEIKQIKFLDNLNLFLISIFPIGLIIGSLISNILVISIVLFSHNTEPNETKRIQDSVIHILQVVTFDISDTTNILYKKNFFLLLLRFNNVKQMLLKFGFNHGHAMNVNQLKFNQK